MTFSLIEDWGAVLTKAWSVKFNILAALLGAAEIVVQMLKPAGVPDGLMAGLAAFVSVATPAVRVLAQKELP